MLCIDPKGENARVTARQRRRFGPVWVLDPFGVSGQLSAAYNPLDAIDAASPDVAEDATTLAGALVSDPPGSSEPHWNEEAKALLTGLILHVAANEEPYQRTLATVRELVTLAPDAFAALLERMQASPAAGGLVARGANRHLTKSDREASGVLSAAQRHTHFLDSPSIGQVMARSDFSFADLKGASAPSSWCCRRTASTPTRPGCASWWPRPSPQWPGHPTSPPPLSCSCSTSLRHWAGLSRSSGRWG